MDQKLSPKPTIAITLGDAAGVGPEVIAAAWADPAIHASGRLLVTGDPVVLDRAVQLVGGGQRIEVIESLDAWLNNDALQSATNVIPCLTSCDAEVRSAPAGEADARAGQAAYDSIMAAVRLALDRRVDAIVTPPICKESLHLAGVPFPGHTELLGHACGVDDFAMMLHLPPGGAAAGPHGLSVVHVTLHMPLRDVFSAISVDSIVACCHLAHRALLDFGAASPRIGVLALNPHAGENGLFGDEESTIIAPAVEEALADGLDVSGPIAADALAPAARDGAFDVLVAMYHDQGHIALKLLDMHHAVNTTLGLPIIRTSVAHGTAFDLAWQGKAETSGMVCAIQVAAGLAARPSGMPSIPFAAPSFD